MQCVSYMPDEKRAILCRKILNSCATRGEILTNDYKQLIELIANHPKIGTSLTPVFMYNNKPCDCSTIKMTITEFRKKLKYNLKGDEFNSKLNIIYNLTTIIYTIAIVNDDVYVRYHTLVDHNDFLT